MSKRSSSQANVDRFEQTSAPASTAMTATTISALPNVSPQPSIFSPQFQPHTYQQEYFSRTRRLSEPRAPRPLSNYQLSHSPLHQPRYGVRQGTTTFSLSRPTRKSKQHVQSACVNCKQAHLSCDDQRPCERCLRRNIGDSCRDVPHRKRGRPRIREQIPNEAAPFPLDRTQRLSTVDSIPKTSEDKSGISPISTESPIGGIEIFPHARPPIVESTPKTPTAFLDTDLRIWATNSTFRERFGFISDFQGQPLHILVDSNAKDSMESLRQVRASQLHERDEKNSSYMPPIREKEDSWKCIIPSVDSQDLSSICRGYTIFRQQLQLLSNGGEPRTVSVEFCLAKATVIFVVFRIPLVQSPQDPTLSNTSSTLASLSPSGLDLRRQSSVSQGKNAEVSRVNSPAKSTASIPPISPTSTIGRQSYRAVTGPPESGTIPPHPPYHSFHSDSTNHSLYTHRRGSESYLLPSDPVGDMRPPSTHHTGSSHMSGSLQQVNDVMLPPITSLGHSFHLRSSTRKEIPEDQKRQERSHAQQAQQRSADRKRRESAIELEGREHDGRSNQPAGQADRPSETKKRKRGLDVKDLTH